MTTPSTQRLSRLLSLVPWLTRHQGVTITEAAEHFGVSPEQLEKDLWLVVCCGLPGHGPDQLIDIQFWDDDGHIDVVDPQTLVAPARLTVEEAATLQVGLSILASLASDEDLELIETTMATLTQATAATGESGQIPVRTDLGSDPGVVAAVARAAEQGRAVEIEYHSATSDSRSQRTIWPQRIVVSSTVAYVEAWCASARSMRTFRVDRIRSLREPVVLRDDEVSTESAREYLSRGALDTGAERSSRNHGPSSQDTAITAVDVRIHRNSRWLLDSYDFDVHGSVPGNLPHNLPDNVPDMTSDDPTWIDARIGVWDQRWLIRLVLSMGGDLVVLAPTAVREAVRVAAERALQGYATA